VNLNRSVVAATDHVIGRQRTERVHSSVVQIQGFVPCPIACPKNQLRCMSFLQKCPPFRDGVVSMSRQQPRLGGVGEAKCVPCATT